MKIPKVTKAALKPGYSLPLKVRTNPGIFKGLDGQTYVVAGSIEGTKGGWLPVPPDTTLETVGRYVEWVKPDVESAIPDKWIIQGSKGDNYTVRRTQTGQWTCTCAGFGFRRKCRHITETKTKNPA